MNSDNQYVGNSSKIIGDILRRIKTWYRCLWNELIQYAQKRKTEFTMQGLNSGDCYITYEENRALKASSTRCWWFAPMGMRFPMRLLWRMKGFASLAIVCHSVRLFMCHSARTNVCILVGISKEILSNAGFAPAVCAEWNLQLGQGSKMDSVYPQARQINVTYN